MISVLSVYNNEEVLKARLLHSLKRQQAHHEILMIDNRGNEFPSAAKALNWGAQQAKGDWLIFVHQDVSFISEAWLAEAEQLLCLLNPNGWAGVSGLTASGKLQTFMLDRSVLIATVFNEACEVQTLDECVLIHRREPVNYQYFDEALLGWHAYGVEACCRAIIEGKKNYVIPLPVWHDSSATNIQGLERSHAHVWRKYGTQIPKIFTTCGLLPDSYEWQQNYGKKFIRKLRWEWTKFLNRYVPGFKGEDFFWNAIEALTQDEPTASVFHRQTKQQPIEAQAFVASPKKRRQIMHYFAPPEDKYWSADCVVITPEVGRDIILNQELLASILSNVRRLILCIDLRVVFLNPSLLFWLCRQVLTWQVVVKSDKEINWDGFSMYTLVIEFLPQTQRNKSAKCNQPLNNCDFIKNSDS